MATPLFLGIDLGTSNSVVTGIVDGKPRLFKTADGADALPSVIYVDKGGTRLYGRRAQEQALLNPDAVAHGFKRLMGSKTPIEFTGNAVKMTAEEASADILRQLLAQAKVETGRDDFAQVVITVPAAFDQMQSEATLRAAERAGLAVTPKLLQEPVAAAIAAAHEGGGAGQFLIYDLGGGTFDLALAKTTDGEISIVANQGINMLGGRDFDRRLVQDVIRPWLADNFALPPDFMRQPKYRRLLRVAQLAAEKAKIDLSSRETASIFATDAEVGTADEGGAPLFLDVSLDRSTFDKLIADTVKRTVAVTQQLLEEQGLKARDIDRLVFIGGPSKIPLIRAQVADALGLTADLSLDPMTTVAYGAALYAAQLGGQAVARTVAGAAGAPAKDAPAKAPPKVTIPAAKTIALKLRDESGDTKSGLRNILQPILTAGTKLPATGSLRVIAGQDLSVDAPGALSFELFQLEFPERLELNLCVGAFRITDADLPAGAQINAGDALNLTWRMDDSGILSASVAFTAGGQSVALSSPQFFAPQEGERSFAGESAVAFATAVLDEATDETAEIAAAMGPLLGGAVKELDMVRHRLAEQRDALRDANGEAELVRQASEEARFIRQDIARLARRFGAAVLQRRLGRMAAAYNRAARALASPEQAQEIARLTALLNEVVAKSDGDKAPGALDATAWNRAEQLLAGYRRVLFAAAWQDAAYVREWLAQTKREAHLFPDQQDYAALLAAAEGAQDEEPNGSTAFRAAMDALLAARVSLAASGSAVDPATIVREG